MTETEFLPFSLACEWAQHWRRTTVPPCSFHYSCSRSWQSIFLRRFHSPSLPYSPVSPPTWCPQLGLTWSTMSAALPCRRLLWQYDTNILSLLASLASWAKPPKRCVHANAASAEDNQTTVWVYQFDLAATACFSLQWGACSRSLPLLAQLSPGRLTLWAVTSHSRGGVSLALRSLTLRHKGTSRHPHPLPPNRSEDVQHFSFDWLILNLFGIDRCASWWKYSLAYVISPKTKPQPCV